MLWGASMHKYNETYLNVARKNHGDFFDPHVGYSFPCVRHFFWKRTKPLISGGTVSYTYTKVYNYVIIYHMYIYIQCLLSSNCILSYVNICYLPILRIFKTSPTVRDSGEGITTHQDVQKVQGHGALFTRTGENMRKPWENLRKWDLAHKIS